jgi:hypothetical protein
MRGIGWAGGVRNVGEEGVAIGMLLANCEHKSLMFCLLRLSLRVEVHMEERC